MFSFGRIRKIVNVCVPYCSINKDTDLLMSIPAIKLLVLICELELDRYEFFLADTDIFKIPISEDPI